MRWTALLVVLAGCDGVFGIGTYQALPDPVGGLVAHYPMDELGDLAHCLSDATGRGHTGTCLGGMPNVVPGKHGMAYQLDGVIQLHVGDAADLDPPSLTVAFWFQIAPSSLGGCAVNRLHAGVPEDTWQICPNADSTYYVAGSAMSHVPKLTVAGEWHHAALTFDGNRAAFWYDGISQLVADSTPLAWDTNDMIIGTDIDNGMPVAGFAGLVDDLRIYERALSQQEIAALFTAI